MTESSFFVSASRLTLLALALCVVAPAARAQAQPRAAAALAPNTADYIVAIVNRELVTNGELQLRIDQVRADAARNKTPLPPPAELRQRVLDALVDERVQLTNARETGPRIDEVELDRAVANVAVQNQMTLPQLRERLAKQGLPYGTFRNNLRDQMVMERVREQDVNARIRIGNDEIEAALAQRRAAAGSSGQLNVAQILVTVPEGASDEVVAQRRALIESALARVQGGEDFASVAREVSEDGNKAQGGVIGLRPADRLPDVFVDAVRSLKPGDIAPTLLRSGAGFHVLKLVEREAAGAVTVTQTHPRHILLRVSEQLTAEAAGRRLAEFRGQIVAGSKTFEQVARENSEDSSAAAGGDLGWVAPGAFVPEFEEAMNRLPIGGISEPLLSRFGVHLIQVMERRQVAVDEKQQREQARNVLREQKFEAAYRDWIRDLRGRAYVELREPPQ
ncbi:MAG: peptidylprolyl isomerase [Burkholderiaceae bacterium]